MFRAQVRRRWRSARTITVPVPPRSVSDWNKTMRARALAAAGLAGIGLLIEPALAQFDAALAPLYSIWDVKIGDPVSQIPTMEVVDISCGTNGGPPSTKLPGGF